MHAKIRTRAKLPRDLNHCVNFIKIGYAHKKTRGASALEPPAIICRNLSRCNRKYNVLRVRRQSGFPSGGGNPLYKPRLTARLLFWLKSPPTLLRLDDVRAEMCVQKCQEFGER